MGSFDTSAGTTSTLVDDLSVAATFITSTVAGGFNQKIELFYYKNYNGGDRTFNYNLGGVLQNNITILAIELFGVDRFNALLGSAVGNGVGTVAATANVSPSPLDDETYFIGAANLNSGSTANAPFSDIYSDLVSFSFASEYLQPSIAALAAAWTQTTGGWQAIMAGFRPDRNQRRRGI
jgi:hypothetical protein